MKNLSIKKEISGRYRFYKVVDENGNVIKEFDDYNFQKPYRQARDFIKAQEAKSVLNEITKTY